MVTLAYDGTPETEPEPAQQLGTAFSVCFLDSKH